MKESAIIPAWACKAAGYENAAAQTEAAENASGDGVDAVVLRYFNGLHDLALESLVAYLPAETVAEWVKHVKSGGGSRAAQTEASSGNSVVKTREVYANGWCVGKFFEAADAEKFAKFAESMRDRAAENFFGKVKVQDSHTYMNDAELEALRGKGVNAEIDED